MHLLVVAPAVGVAAGARIPSIADDTVELGIGADGHLVHGETTPQRHTAHDEPEHSPKHHGLHGWPPLAGG